MKLQWEAKAAEVRGDAETARRVAAKLVNLSQEPGQHPFAKLIITLQAKEAEAFAAQAAGDPNINPAKAFNGYFSLTATIRQVGGVWTVQSGSFTIEGDLQGGAKTDLLLAGNLATGADGSAWGYDPPVNNHTASHLEFLFQPTSGNSKILQDFFGTSGVGGGLVAGVVKLWLGAAQNCPGAALPARTVK